MSDDEALGPVTLELLRGVAQAGTERAVLQPGTLLAHYRIERCLGRGGMGAVYLARDERLVRTVAIKVLASGADPVALLAEGRAAAAVVGAHVAHIYEAGQADGTAFLVMEYVPGVSLREWLQGAPTERSRQRMASSLLEAAAHLHRAGLVHCDLKPENVMVDRDGVLKLVDFGLARLHHVQELPVGGTDGYVAPEVVAGQRPTSAADVFALGRLLAELIPSTVEGRAGEVFRAARHREAALRPGVTELQVQLQRIIRRRGPVWWGLVVAVLAMLFLVLHRPMPAVESTERLTGFPVEFSVDSAAISEDGVEVAWVSDEVLNFTTLATPRLSRSVDAGASVLTVDARRPSGWFIVIREASGGLGLRVWERDGSWREVVTGRGRFLSASDDERVRAEVADDGRSITVTTPGGPQAIEVGDQFVCAAQVAPSGRWVLARLCGAVPALRIYAAEGGAIVWQLEHGELAQAYSTPVAAWADDDGLMYARVDAPGVGDGSAVFMVRPTMWGGFAESRRLTWSEGQSFQALSMSARGQLLSLRINLSGRPVAAELDGQATLGALTPLSNEQFDTRFSSFAAEPPGYWGTRLTQRLPSLVGPVSTPAEMLLHPVPTGRRSEYLAWQAQLATPRLQLIRGDAAGLAVVALPFEVDGTLGARPPPRDASVRCAQSRPLCFVARLRAGEVELWRVRLDERGVERVTGLPRGLGTVLALGVSGDGERLAVASGPNELTFVGGPRLEPFKRHRFKQLEHVYSVALDASGDITFVSGIARGTTFFRVVKLEGEVELPVYGHNSIQLTNVVLSADGRSLGGTQKSFDTDLWLTKTNN